MQRLDYTVSFNTPAFLGDAKQEGQWRTPPFKALLRQWWRVLKANGYAYDHNKIRAHEGDLFGNAWLTDAEGNPLHRKSRISLRLGQWSAGTLNSNNYRWDDKGSVTTTRNGKGSVRCDVYLGYGPVLPKNNIRPAIAPDKQSILTLLPERLESLKPAEQDMADIRDTLQLMAWFGTLGSRSRNGWGSLSMTAMDDTPAVTPLPDAQDRLLARICREWTDCFDRDWPHAIGCTSGRPLIWLTQPAKDWRKIMCNLAQVRVAVRRKAKGYVGPAGISGIHILGYPAGGNWSLPQLSKGKPKHDDQEGRLASQLRFKVVRVKDELCGVVFHMPHRFPDTLRTRLNHEQEQWLAANEQQVWANIHATLDNDCEITRLGGKK